MRYVLIGIIAIFTLSCAALSPALDESTGTTREQRCVDYRALYAAAAALQETNPTVARQARMAYYRGFINAYCEVLKDD